MTVTSGGYCGAEYFPTLYAPSQYFPRYNDTPTPPVPVVHDQGGGGGRRDRRNEMSVEEWRYQNRLIAEDERILTEGIKIILKAFS